MYLFSLTVDKILCVALPSEQRPGQEVDVVWYLDRENYWNQISGLAFTIDTESSQKYAFP